MQALVWTRGGVLHGSLSSVLRCYEQPKQAVCPLTETPFVTGLGCVVKYVLGNHRAADHGSSGVLREGYIHGDDDHDDDVTKQTYVCRNTATATEVMFIILAKHPESTRTHEAYVARTATNEPYG